MRSFDHEEWTPSGPRWITQIPLSGEASDLGDAYATTAQSWCSQHPSGGHQLRTVARPFRHLTLSTVDIPATEVPAEQVAQLRAGLDDQLATIAPFSLHLGPAIVNTVAVELYVAPSTALADLQRRVAEVYRAVFPGQDAAPVGKRFRGHSAIAYCQQEFLDDGLTSALLRTPGEAAGYQGPATVTVDHVVLAPTDAWSKRGMWWDEDRAVRIPLS